MGCKGRQKSRRRERIGTMKLCRLYVVLPLGFGCKDHTKMLRMPLVIENAGGMVEINGTDPSWR